MSTVKTSKTLAQKLRREVVSTLMALLLWQLFYWHTEFEMNVAQHQLARLLSVVFGVAFFLGLPLIVWRFVAWRLGTTTRR